MNSKIKPVHVVTKTIFQIFLYVVEIAVICGILTFLSFRFSGVSSEGTIMQIIERFFIFYGVYELLVFCIFNNINDIKADEYLALKTLAEMATLAVETHDKRVLSYVDNVIQKELKPEKFNDIVVRGKYNELNNFILNDDIAGIKFLAIEANHFGEESHLQWRFSFLLRLFK